MQIKSLNTVVDSQVIFHSGAALYLSYIPTLPKQRMTYTHTAMVEHIRSRYMDALSHDLESSSH